MRLFFPLWGMSEPPQSKKVRMRRAPVRGGVGWTKWIKNFLLFYNGRKQLKRQGEVITLIFVQVMF